MDREVLDCNNRCIECPRGFDERRLPSYSEAARRAAASGDPGWEERAPLPVARIARERQRWGRRPR
ncbi:MAG: hypothetical protein Kow0092_14850 [Deferrisomatales bacterium]